jgi:hypothetical protein
MEKKESTWETMKHEPSKRTDCHNLIRGMMEKELKMPTNPTKKIINLGLGTLPILNY